MNAPPLCNYHTHTWRCHHAIGEVVEYAEAAQRVGIQVLGMSDHTPMPDGRWETVRMSMDQLDEYLEAIDAAREALPDLTILKALECEYVPEFDSFFRDELLGTHGLDYLVCGAHSFPRNEQWFSMYGDMNTPDDLRDYADYIVQSMQSGLFAFIAHPDLFAAGYLTWDADTEACSRDILAAAAELGIPLEINGYGLRKPIIDTPDGPRRQYPWEPFWQLATEYDIRIVANSDAHHPEDVDANIAEALAMADRLGLAIADLSHLHPQRPAPLS